jgi:hypothetical protein
MAGNKHYALSREKLLALPYVFDGMGAEIVGNPFGFFPLPFAGYIRSVSLAGDVAPTLLVEIDIQTCALADYPSGLASIVGSTPPTLDGVEQMKDSLLTGWTTEFVADTVFKFIVLHTDTVKLIAVVLNVIRF